MLKVQIATKRKASLERLALNYKLLCDSLFNKSFNQAFLCGVDFQQIETLRQVLHR